MERVLLAETLARDVGAYLQRVFRHGVASRLKEDGSTVTEADEEAEQRILAAIREHFPDDAIVAEESGGQDGASGVTWYIDPLDGTTNFSRGIPVFGTSIAFADKEGVLGGAVALPTIDALVVAERGSGTRWMSMESGKETRTLRVRSSANAGEPLLLLSYSDRDDPRIMKLRSRDLRVRIFGSAAANLCFLAAGAAQGCIFLNQHAWDYAAGILCVEEAGGRVTALDGTPLDFPSARDLLAASPEGIPELLELAALL